MLIQPFKIINGLYAHCFNHSIGNTVIHSSAMSSALCIKALCVLFTLLLSGCAAINVVGDVRTDGLYMIDSFSASGKVRTVYQFADNNVIYITKRKNFSDADAIKWSQDRSRASKTYVFNNGRVNLYGLRGDIKGVAEEALGWADYTLGNRSFYAFSESGLTFERKIEMRRTDKTISLYSGQGERVFSDKLVAVRAVAGDSFILQYPDNYVLYDAQSKASLLDATFMSALSGTQDLVMAYKASGFGVVDSSGREVVPFIYDDMMDLGQGIIGTMTGEIWSIRDVEGNFGGNRLVTLPKNSVPLSKRLTGQIIPVLINDNARFYSLSSKRFLKFTTSLFYPVASSDAFFVGMKKKKWVLVKNNGSYGLPFYIRSALHDNDYLIVRDLEGNSKVFTQAGKLSSIYVHGSLSFMGDKYSLQEKSEPVLRLSRDKGRGITDIKGRVLVEPTYEAIHYLGNGHFHLKNKLTGQSNQDTEIYVEGNGIMTLPVRSAEYVNGDVIIVSNKARKYGLWSTLNSDWVVTPSEYDLIENSVDSEYLTYRVKKGISYNSGVMKTDGTVIYPTKLQGDVSIEGDYLYASKNGRITLYRLPDMQEVMQVPGARIAIEDNGYFVVKGAE